MLAVTFNGEAYYAGYIVVTEIRFGNADNILADVLQLDLSKGQAAIANIPMKAFVGLGVPGCAQINTLLSINNGVTILDNYEVFSGDSMAAADNRVWTGLCADATWFALYPRYLINDANSADTFWIFLRSSVRSATTGGLVAEIPFHTWIINGAEEYRSTTINIREMSILSAKAVIPSVLKVSLPYIGQINLKIPGELDPGTSTPVPSDTYLSMELFGWNWKVAASSSASLNWAGMTLIGADAGTTGTGYWPAY